MGCLYGKVNALHVKQQYLYSSQFYVSVCNDGGKRWDACTGKVNELHVKQQYLYSSVLCVKQSVMMGGKSSVFCCCL